MSSRKTARQADASCTPRIELRERHVFPAYGAGCGHLGPSPWLRRGKSGTNRPCSNTVPQGGIPVCSADIRAAPLDRASPPSLQPPPPGGLLRQYCLGDANFLSRPRSRCFHPHLRTPRRFRQVGPVCLLLAAPRPQQTHAAWLSRTLPIGCSLPAWLPLSGTLPSRRGGEARGLAS